MKLVIDHIRRGKNGRTTSLEAAPAPQDSGNGDEASGWTLEIPDSKHDPVACLLAVQLNEALQTAFAALPANNRVTMILLGQKCSYAEIAEALDKPVGTIRSRIHRSRVLLRKALQG